MINFKLLVTMEKIKNPQKFTTLNHYTNITNNPSTSLRAAQTTDNFNEIEISDFVIELNPAERGIEIEISDFVIELKPA